MKDETTKRETSADIGQCSASSFILYPSSFLLGAFILFQLLYLPAANFIKLVALRLPESKGELDDDIQLRGQQFPDRVQTLADAAGTAFVRWGELTGQAQGWSLFAPIFGHQASLPATGFDGPGIYSDFIPKDPSKYFRLPWSNCRLFNFEYRLALLYWTWTAERMREEPGLWRRAGLMRVRRQQRSLQSFMNWRLHQYVTANPTAPPPTQVTLFAQLLPAPDLDLETGPRTRFGFWIARYLPGTQAPAGCLPVQAWDTDAFIWLRIEDEP
jgi:hypothetical protein